MCIRDSNEIEQRRDADIPHRRARRTRRPRAWRRRPHRQAVQRSGPHAHGPRDVEAEPGMISRQLLNIVMLVEIGLLVLAVCLFFAHGLWLFFYERRLARLTEAARESLAHLATRGTVNVEEIEALRRLPHDVQ